MVSIGLDELSDRHNERVPPTRILFICPAGVHQQLAESFRREHEQFKDRLRSASHITVAPYDETGRLNDEQIVHLKSSSTNWELKDRDLQHFALVVVKGIYSETNTVLQAPHGYKFRKLSQREEDIFVRAGNMLRDPGCLPFFNHLLLRQLPDGCNEVYIESFTIFSFALGLHSVVTSFWIHTRDLAWNADCSRSVAGATTRRCDRCRKVQVGVIHLSVI